MKKKISKFNNSPLTQLKIVEGLFKEANLKELLYELKFYYLLKNKNIQGFFKNAKIKVSNFSQSYIYKMFQKLTKLGWLKKCKDGYYLISYKNLFNYFGISPKKKKIFCISAKQIAQFELIIAFFEIKLNLFRQNWLVRKLIKQVSIQKTEQDKPINTFCSLSCQGISNLLGYISAKKGYEIEHELVSMGLISITKRISKRGNMPLMTEIICLKSFSLS
jgi:hypothetical protein